METNACDERLVRNGRPFLLEKTGASVAWVGK